MSCGELVSSAASAGSSGLRPGGRRVIPSGPGPFATLAPLLVVADERGRILAAAPGSARVLGLGEAAAIGASVLDLVASGHGAAQAAWRRIVAGPPCVRVVRLRGRVLAVASFTPFRTPATDPGPEGPVAVAIAARIVPRRRPLARGAGEAGDDAGAVDPVVPVLEALLDEAMHAFPEARGAAAFLADEDGDALVARAARGAVAKGPWPLARSLSVDGEDAIVRAFRDGRAVAGPLSLGPGFAPSTAGLALPLRVPGSRALGVLAISGCGPEETIRARLGRLDGLEQLESVDLLDRLDFIRARAVALDRLRLQARLARSRERQKRLANLGEAIVAPRERGALLERVCRMTADIFGDGFGAFVLELKEDGAFAVVASTDLPAEIASSYRPRRETSLAGLAVRTGEVLAVRDLAAADLAPGSLGDGDEGVLAERGGVRGLLIAPLGVTGRGIGALAVASRAPRRFFSEERALGAVLAGAVAIALENARLFDTVERNRSRLRELSSDVIRAQEDERKRLARELNDGVAQGVGAASMELNRLSLAARPGGGGSVSTADLEALGARLGDAFQELRAMARAHRPPGLETRGLGPALRSLVEDFGRRTGVACSFEEVVAGETAAPGAREPATAGRPAGSSGAPARGPWSEDGSSEGHGVHGSPGVHGGHGSGSHGIPASGRNGPAPEGGGLQARRGAAPGSDGPAESGQGRRNLPAEVEINLYRIAQEALANVARHAQSSKVRVELRRGPGIALTVVDDGRGFDAREMDPRGVGLLGMEERAHLMGGRLRVESRPGRGTRIEVEVEDAAGGFAAVRGGAGGPIGTGGAGERGQARPADAEKPKERA